jgi:3-deoxy-D-manno-octulosonic-acid transferase
VLLIYSILFFLAWPLVFLAFVWKYGLRKSLRGLPERFGWGGPWPEKTGALWVHAASVGEVRAAEQLLRALPARFQGVPRFLTTTTVNGKDLAVRLALAETVRLAPVDRPGVFRAALRRVQPRCVVLVETELWPHWLDVLAREKIPAAVVNGRVSDGAYPLYRALKKLWSPLLSTLARVGVQSPRNAARFLALGADARRVVITGNLKNDVPLPDPARIPALKKAYGFADGDPVWVMGSTQPAEEPLLRDVLTALRKNHPALKAVVAPRRIERAAETRRRFEEAGYSCALRSQLSSVVPAPEVLVLDTVGELAEIYGVATVAFVGGSLVRRGGQNPLEPARWGVPVVYGPSMENFREIDDALRAAGGARVAADGEALRAVVDRWLATPLERGGAGAAARSVADGERGALEDNLRLIEETLTFSPDEIRPRRAPCAGCPS